MADRDDANLKHFTSRSKQPRGYNLPVPTERKNNPIQIDVNVHYDSNWGNTSSEIDDMRFRRMGTSPAWSMYQSSCSRRSGQDCMRSTFNV